ncbi:MAG: tetratricopeptide repeat protein [Betaproteobacteria bacterium]|nr:tetratricopeptide repeat protein [Betaproteobacteria bacterium]
MTRGTDPRDQPALQGIAAHYEAGRLDEADAAAIAFLSQGLPRERELPALLWRGFIADRRGDTAAARDFFEAARQIDRRNPQLLAQLGALHDRMGDSAKAESCYREALRQEPRLPIAHYNLGVVLQRKRDFAGARRAYEAAVLHEPQLHPAWLNLGNVFRDLKDDASAKDCYRRALEIEPRFALAHHALGVLAQVHRQSDAAIACFRAALASDPTHLESWLDLAETLHRIGDKPGAMAALEEAAQFHPGHATLEFKRAVLAGEQAAAMPDAVVEKIFDGLAGEFDAHLVGRLGYAIPAQLRAMLADWLAARRKVSVLDLGCGTGLFGLEVVAYASRLVGIDLSARMVEQSRQRNVYSELHAMSIDSYLSSHADRFDLIVATDVLVYVGALEALFASVCAHLAPGGRFAFSTESPASLAEGFVLLPTGRYAHSAAYVQSLAQANGLKVVAQDPAIIRTEANVPIDGFVFVLERGE